MCVRTKFILLLFCVSLSFAAYEQQPITVTDNTADENESPLSGHQLRLKVQQVQYEPERWFYAIDTDK